MALASVGAINTSSHKNVEPNTIILGPVVDGCILKVTPLVGETYHKLASKSTWYHGEGKVARHDVTATSRGLLQTSNKGVAKTGQTVSPVLVLMNCGPETSGREGNSKEEHSIPRDEKSLVGLY